MKKSFAAILTLLPAAFAQFQPQIDVRAPSPGVLELVGINPHPVPFTMDITLDLVNYDSSAGESFRAILPKNSDNNVLTSLTVPDPSIGSSWSFSISYDIGDATAEPEDYPYRLPFEVGTSRLISQGENGSFSHNTPALAFAIDFEMPVGTPVFAVRSGVVIDVKEDSNHGCGQASCQNQGNYLLVLHDDSTLGEYFHFQQHGVLVEVGDTVARGQQIGLSGNTGWTSGPHLHFNLSRIGGTLGLRNSISANFLHSNGLGVLQEGSSYQSSPIPAGGADLHYNADGVLTVPAAGGLVVQLEASDDAGRSWYPFGDRVFLDNNTMLRPDRSDGVANRLLRLQLFN